LPDVSVVVATRDRTAALEACLTALDAGTAAGRVEVVVVDDGSADADAVASVVASHAGARLVRQAAAGPASARNAGAGSARGAILCFTDDDCVPERDWAEGLAAAIAQGAEVVAGTTLSAGGALADAAELIAHAPAMLEPFAPSNNLACTRALFEAFPFDATYPDAAGEDRDWCARVVAAGHELRFTADARLQHRQELTLGSFLARQVRYGQAAYRYRRRHAGGRVAPAAFYAALLRRAFGHGVSVGALVATAQVATALGFISARIGDARAGAW
jgi:glycosyltransferase involved in cell wall biosynthesis